MTARARNVSEGGIFVSVSDPVEVGTELSCEMSIDGVQHQLRARVAWTHHDQPDRPAAVGLEFHDLAPDHEAALRSLVAAHVAQGERSRVWFDGVPDAIVGRTEHFEHGAVLRAPLPFLELGRQVRLESGQAERIGHVASITLATNPETQVPYLRIEFSFVPRVQAPSAAETTEKVDTTPPRRHPVRTLAGAIVGAACIVLAVGASRHGGRTDVIAATVAPRAAMLSPGIASLHTQQATVDMPEPDLAPTVQPDSADVPAASVDGVEVRHGSSTEIEIPLAGATDEAESYRLDDPPGLAINLPHASVSFPLGDTRVGTGGVEFVRVSRRFGGIQVRLHFTGTVERPYDLEVEADRVTITVHPTRH